MCKCVIFSGMPVSTTMRLYVPADAFVIAADAGWRQAEALGVRPHLVVGDFDSSAPPQAAQVIRLPQDKNETDTYYAAREAVARGYRDITILGGMGGRFDHTVANLQTLAYLAESGANNLMADENTELRCIAPGSISIAGRPDCYLSVFSAAGIARGVTVAGVKFPLQNAVLTSDFPLGVSNEFLPGASAHISLAGGLLLVMLVRKEHYGTAPGGLSV